MLSSSLLKMEVLAMQVKEKHTTAKKLSYLINLLRTVQFYEMNNRNNILVF